MKPVGSSVLLGTAPPAAPTMSGALQEFQELLLETFVKEWLSDSLPGESAVSGFAKDMLATSLARAVSRSGMGLVHDPAAPPSHSARVTSGFGQRQDPIDGHRRFHAGVDLAARNGDPVHAVETGRVVFAGPRGGYGNLVEIEHSDGRKSRYAHLSVVEVAEGDAVHAGSRIARVGETGRATGPHLHLETRSATGAPEAPSPSAIRKSLNSAVP